MESLKITDELEAYAEEEAEATLEDGAEIEEEDDGEFPTTFDVGSRTFEIKITKKRLDLYEQRHTPIMASFIKNEGALSSAELASLLGYSLRVVGGGYVEPKQGAKMAEQLIEANGYSDMLAAAFQALQNDCGFLFK